MQKEWKQKIPRKLFVHFDYDNKKEWHKKSWVDKVTEFAGEFKKLWKAEGTQIYSTMSETKAAFAKRTKRSLKKNYFTVTWKTIDTSTFTNWLNSLQH